MLSFDKLRTRMENKKTNNLYLKNDSLQLLHNGYLKNG